MKRLNGWQRLWLVGFIPWVAANSWAITYIDEDWLLIWTPVEFLFPTEPGGVMWVPALLLIFTAFLVPYIALYYLVKLSWRASVWVRAGFRDASN